MVVLEVLLDRDPLGWSRWWKSCVQQTHQGAITVPFIAHHSYVVRFVFVAVFVLRHLNLLYEAL